MPLTGDASDRKYFRVIPSDGPSIVLALHAGPIDFAALPFANVAALLRQVPLPVPMLLRLPSFGAEVNSYISGEMQKAASTLLSLRNSSAGPIATSN